MMRESTRQDGIHALESMIAIKKEAMDRTNAQIKLAVLRYGHASRTVYTLGTEIGTLRSALHILKSENEHNKE